MIGKYTIEGSGWHIYFFTDKTYKISLSDSNIDLSSVSLPTSTHKHIGIEKVEVNTPRHYRHLTNSSKLKNLVLIW